MIQYKNEASFSQSLCKHFRAMGYMVTRIESGSTGNGIPDLFIAYDKGVKWIELKRIKCNLKYWNKISWRPGQQGWMLQLKKATQGKHEGITIVAFNDCIGIINHDRLYKDNMVCESDMIKCNSIKGI